MLKILKFVLPIYILASLSSCVSYKNVPYFQDLDSAQVNLKTMDIKPPLIKKDDILGVYISSLSETTGVLFGVPPSEIQGDGARQLGFLVDSKGEIVIPTIGNVQVVDFTSAQVEEIIKQKAAEYVKNPSVTIRVLNFKISVNGEVAKAGVFNIPNGKVNVLEAIAMAGDMKLSGKRENVLIIRQDEGQVKFQRLDLRSKDVFSSPFFYLKNNDMIYVEPNFKNLERNENVYRNVTIGLSALTVMSLLIYRL